MLPKRLLEELNCYTMYMKSYRIGSIKVKALLDRLY